MLLLLMHVVIEAGMTLLSQAIAGALPFPTLVISSEDEERSCFPQCLRGMPPTSSFSIQTFKTYLEIRFETQLT